MKEICGGGATRLNIVFCSGTTGLKKTILQKMPSKHRWLSQNRVNTFTSNAWGHIQSQLFTVIRFLLSVMVYAVSGAGSHRRHQTHGRHVGERGQLIGGHRHEPRRGCRSSSGGGRTQGAGSARDPSTCASASRSRRGDGDREGAPLAELKVHLPVENVSVAAADKDERAAGQRVRVRAARVELDAAGVVGDRELARADGRAARRGLMRDGQVQRENRDEHVEANRVGLEVTDVRH